MRKREREWIEKRKQIKRFKKTTDRIRRKLEEDFRRTYKQFLIEKIGG